jgi:hypothetical protein
MAGYVMPVMELYPTLEYCIETTARIEFDRITAHCLNGGTIDADTEARIQILRDFLETADFRTLRQESAFWLIVGEKVRFTLTDNGENLSYRMEVL